MALSVKRFIHEIDCPEPENQVNVTYHVNDPSLLCAGGGTPTAIFSDDGTTLGGIIENEGSGNAGEGGLCADGMDVVFVVDYTNSMSGAISGVKTGLNNLVSTIDTASSGNYRLGLVLFDGRGSTSPVYASSGYYQELPASQKINVANSNGANGGNIYITCVEKMNTVGNSTSFSNALNAIDQPNSDEGMQLGSSTECGGQATYEVVANDFAGSFRSGVQKLIILVTDDDPENTTTWFQNTLTPALNNAGAQVMINSSQASDTLYSYIANNTQPAGSTHYGLNFNGTWTTGLETSINELCEETFTYTCETIPAGWYLENGQTTAYYWDGSAWTDSDACEYTVRINLSENIANATLDAVSSSNAYYVDANTIEITGTVGTTFSYTGSVSPINGDYEISNITNSSTTVVSGAAANVNSIGVFTDGGEGTPGQNGLLAIDEFQVSGNIQASGEYNIQINGTTSENDWNFELFIIGDETDQPGYGSGDTTGADGETFSPGGFTVVDPVLPASGWVNEASTYTRSAYKYTFTGTTGTEFDFDVGFTPNPTDYDFTLKTATHQGSNSNSYLALQNKYTLSDANKDLTGTFAMPSGGGSAEIFVNAQVNQPEYSFNLTASESITGVSINGAPYSQTFTGYTGDTFNFTIQLSADFDYGDFDINGVTKSGADTGSVVYTINNTNKTVTGTVTMPQGGGDCNLAIAGKSDGQLVHTYTITFVDPYTDTANWQQIIFTGTTGSFHPATHSLSNQQADTTYYVGTSGNSDGVTNDDSSNLVSNRNHATDNSVTDLNIVLASMPQGGGSATVTITGSQAINEYTYTVTWSMASSNTTPACTFSNGSTSTYTQTFTGEVGDPVSASAQVSTPLDYVWRGEDPVEVSGILNGSATEPNTYTSNLSGISSIPSGGGNLTVTVTPDIRSHIYTYTATVQTNGSTSSVNNYSEAFSSNANAVSGSNNSNGTVTITYVGMVGTVVNKIDVAVQPNNSTDYTTEITSISSPSVFSITETNYGGEGMDIDFTMPSLDARSSNSGTGTITANVTLSAITHTFTLTTNDSISNVSPNTAVHTLTGGVGAERDWATTYSATSGYDFSITDRTITGSNVSAVSAIIQPGSKAIAGNIIMPSGGGSATVTAQGSSNIITYPATITWNNGISGAFWAGTAGSDTVTQTVNLQPGNSTTLLQTVSPDSGRELVSLSATDNSGNVSVSSTNASNGSVSISVSMPSNATAGYLATVTTSGTTRVITRSLTVSYLESITGAFISSGTGSGAGPVTSDTWSGVPGATGSRTLYLVSEDGYNTPSITSITRSNTTHIPSASDTASSGSTDGVGYDEWQYTYRIPSSNASATITINGSVDTNCEFCTINAGANAPTTYNGSDGVITVVYAEGSCNEPLTWSISPSAGIQGESPFGGPQWTGASPGTYTITVTDSFGCESELLIAVPNATTTTTTQGDSSYNYYRAIGCDTGNLYIVRSTMAFPLSSSIATNKSGEDRDMCLDKFNLGPAYDYSITGLGTCECEGGAK